MWLTEESAPTDGILFLVIEQDSPAVWAPWELVFWDGEQFSAKDTNEEISFEYWMPLNESIEVACLSREYAPKDGSWFLVIAKDSDSPHAPYELAYWNGNQFCECDVKVEIDFDLWMPLPKPPLE